MFSMGRSRKTRDPSSTENTPVKKKSREESGMDDNAMSQSIKLTDNMTTPAPSPRPSASRSLEAPPNWFVEFEARQEARFESLFKECREAHAAFDHDMKNLRDEVETLKKKLKAQDSKLDDLENRNRRNNIVIFNVPEGFEGDNCMTFIQKLIKDNCNIEPKFIQRCHRSGKPGPKPRPIHVGFSFYPEKEACRKALSDLFRRKKFGDAKLFASNDFSQTVQKMRKEKLPEIRRLKDQGLNAFLVYPATVKIRDRSGQIRDP